jgi:hypothetical protein
MGAGSAAKYGSAGTGDEEPEAAWSPPGYRQAEPASGGGETSRAADRPDEDDDQAARADVGEARWERMVPPYVDDLTRPRRDREPAGSGSGDLPAREDSPAGEEAEAAAGQESGSVWSAWSGFRAARAEEAASSGHDLPGQAEQRDEDERRREDEQGRERADRAERDLPGRVPDGGPSAGYLAESRATAGSVTSGDAAASDEADEDEIAAAARATDVAGGEASATSTGGTSADTPRGDDGAAGASAGTLETERAGQPDHASEGDRTAAADGTEAEGSGAEDTAEEDPVEADADGAGGTGRATAAKSAGSPEDTDAGEDADQGAGDGATPLDDEVTIVPGVARYHRRGCILIRFLSDGDLEIMTRREAEATGLVPCKACQPDKPDPSV